MKGFLTVLLIIVVVVSCIVIPSVQYYNYYAFRNLFEEDTLEGLVTGVKKVDDEEVLIAKRKIIDEMTSQGYPVEDEQVSFLARVPGSIRFYSEHIYQISDPNVDRTTLEVIIRFEYRILMFSREAKIRYEKKLKD